VGIDPEFAFDPARGQYHSTAILRHLAGVAGGDRLLGVAAVDLYVPIFTFVYGEAQLGGPAALVSTHRLRPEFYGEAANGEVVAGRLLKESLHELGHTYGLRHCQDWSCPMATSTAIERLDWKGERYCDACWGQLS
jgi:archaemetzincin